jgi:hypothetical protein
MSYAVHSAGQTAGLNVKSALSSHPDGWQAEKRESAGPEARRLRVVREVMKSLSEPVLYKVVVKLVVTNWSTQVCGGTNGVVTASGPAVVRDVIVPFDGIVT